MRRLIPLHSVYLLIWLLFLPLGVMAKDVYVSNSGSGDLSGVDEDNMLPFSQLKSVLSSHRADTGDDDDKELNVYFDGDTYHVPSGGFTFNSTAARTYELEVLFIPIDESSQVIFDGAANNVMKFVSTNGTSSSNSEKAMSVGIENVIIQNFASTSSGSNTGNTSLLYADSYTTISLTNVIVRNIQSYRNPLIVVNTGTFTVDNCILENITITDNNSYPIIGTPATSTSYRYCTFEISNTEIINCTTAGNGYLIGITSNYSNLYLDNVTVTGHTFHGINLTSDNGNSILKNVKINNIISSVPLITVGSSSHTLTLSECEFSGNTISSSNGALYVNNISSLTIESSFFSNNECTANAASFFNIRTGNPVTLNNSTFVNNKLTGSGGNQYLLYLESLNEILIYNNTFSGNTPLAGNDQNYGTIYVSSTGSNLTGGIINNTFYNNDSGNSSTAGTGGGIRIATNYAVQNNLLINSGYISGTTTNLAKTRRNIFEGAFYETGVTQTEIISNIESCIDPTLEIVEGKIIKVHPLPLMDGHNPVFKKGGTKNLIENGYGNLVTFDQRSRRRPDEISLGSWDLPNFGAIQRRYTIPYEEGMNFENEYLIDLAEYITTYPEDKHADNISYEIISQPGNGTVRLGTDKRYAYFTPHTEVDGTPSAGIVGATYDMIYRVYTYIGTTLFETLVTLKIAIVNVNLPLGIVDQSVVECYTDMETTEFIAEMKFETGRINQPSRFDGYTIPLVGDLNGDGKPEIVVLGIAERTSQSARRPADAYYLYIINGQTGEQIVKYSIPTFPIRGPYHNTPSFLALVDADRDGMGKIIIAYGDTKNSTYQKRIVCYEVNENTFDPDMKITDQGKLTEKWISDERYDAHAGGYINPGTRYNVTMSLVQVVDIDGDGQAEIIVYNKFIVLWMGHYW